MKPEPDPSRTVAIILAAGLGTRMKSQRPKVLHELCGRPMLGYVVEAATTATGSRPLVVYSPPTVAVTEAFANAADFALQDEPRGTADALLAALRVLPPDAARVLVVYGDVPLLEAGLLGLLLEAQQASSAAIALVTVVTIDPGRLGRIVRDEDGLVARIVEAQRRDRGRTRDRRDQCRHLRARGGLAARPDRRPRAVAGDRRAVPDRPRRAGPGPTVGPSPRSRSSDDGTLLGINDRAELADATYRPARTDQRGSPAGRRHDAGPVDRLHRRRRRPGRPTSRSSRTSSCAAGRRSGRAPRSAPARSSSTATVGRDCRIWASVLESSEVEDERVDRSVRPPPAGLVDRARRASSATTPRSRTRRLGRGVQQHHMSYLGDADVGARTNVGAGTITANYDGTHEAPDDDRRAVPSSGSTRCSSPRSTIGDGAKTGAGAVVTRDVPPGKLAVGMPARIREPRPWRDQRPAGAAVRGDRPGSEVDG